MLAAGVGLPGVFYGWIGLASIPSLRTGDSGGLAPYVAAGIGELVVIASALGMGAVAIWRGGTARRVLGSAAIVLALFETWAVITLLTHPPSFLIF